MTKTKQPKPVKAWGIVDKNGVLEKETYASRGTARFCKDIDNAGKRVVRVEIEVKRK